MAEHALAGCAILLFTLVLFLPLAQGRAFSMVGAHMAAMYPWYDSLPTNPAVTGHGFPQTDQAEEYYPHDLVLSRALRGGELPLWSPHSFGGVPLLGQPNLGLFYPPKLLAALVLTPLELESALQFSHLLLAGLAMYALLRVWGTGLAGGLLGASIWEANGHQAFFLVLGHAALLAPWLPLMLLTATLTVRQGSLRWAIGTGGALGMAILTGSLYRAYLGGLLLAGWWSALILVQLIRGGRAPHAVLIGSPIVALLVAGLLGAAQLGPFPTFIAGAHREALSVEQQVALATPMLTALRELAFRGIMPGLLDSDAPPTLSSMSFVGTPGLLLVLPAVMSRSAPVMVSLATLLVSFGIVTGFVPLIQVLASALPWFTVLRTNAAYFVLTFALAVLAAFGMTNIGRLIFSRKPVLWTLAATLTLIVQGWHLAAYAWSVNPMQPATPEWLYPETPLVTRLRDLSGSARMMALRTHAPENAWTPPVLYSRVPAVFGLKSAGGYESLLSLSSLRLWMTVHGGGVIAALPLREYRSDLFHDHVHVGLLRAVSASLVVTAPGIAPGAQDGTDLEATGALIRVYDGSDGRIFSVQDALPRAFLVPGVEVLPDIPSVLTRMADPDFNPRRGALISADQVQNGFHPLRTELRQSSGTAKIADDRSNEVTIDVVADEPAILVLNDAYSPEWRVWIDGQEGRSVRVNYDFRGVAVPAGAHQVVFAYRPPLLPLWLGLTGLMLMGLTLAGCIGGIQYAQRIRNDRQDTEIPPGPENRG